MLEDALAGGDSEGPAPLGGAHGKVLEGEWKTVVSTKWHSRVHINESELRCARMALQHAASRPCCRGTRLPLYVDSSAAIGAAAKGRSASRRLNHVCRQIAAVVLAAELRVAWFWVPTAQQPADAASRPPAERRAILAKQRADKKSLHGPKDLLF